MNELENLAKEVKELKEKHPIIAESIQDLFELCLCEIEEGGSQTNEINIFRNSIEELINEN